MSVHVLMNLLNELSLNDKMRELPTTSLKNSIIQELACQNQLIKSH